MGGGSSVLSAELSKNLTQPSLEKFHQMQAECEAKNMTPMEMYVYLTARYEELVKAEQEAVNALSATHSSGKGKGAGSSSNRKSAPSKPPLPHPKKNPDHHPLTRQQSNKLEEEYLSKDIMTEMEESLDVDFRPIYDPYIESVVGKVFNVVDDPHVQNVVDMLIETGDVPKSKTGFVMENSFVKQLENGGFECTVCRMNFDNRKALDAHIAHSPVHSVNMKIRQEIFQTTLKEAQRLAALAHQTINKLNGKEGKEGHEGGATPSATPRDGPEAAAKLKWKKAVNKVICNRLKTQFLPLIEQICETPVGVKMLHAGSKFFYKSKVTFDLHVYLHVAQDVVEIVPHFIPGRKQKLASVTPCPRIYLDFRILMPLVLGVDITNSRLSIHESNIVSPSTNFASGVTSRVVALATSQSEPDPNLNKTIETAITSYILNHLSVVHEVKGADYRLIFDLHGIQNSPLLPGPPADIKIVPVSLEKIKSQYEEQIAAARRRSRTSATASQNAATAAEAVEAIGSDASPAAAAEPDGTIGLTPRTARDTGSTHSSPRPDPAPQTQIP